MRGSLRFVILSCFIQILVADVTYNVEDVCRGTKKKMGTNDILRRHFSKRQFGAILDIPRSESVVVVLRTHNPSVTPSFLIPSSANIKSTKDTDVGRSSLDCRFTLKPSKPGSNVTIATEWQNMISNCSSYLQIIHSPDMLLIRMTESGSYTFTNTLYFPLHVRLSICNNSESQHPGFLLIASGSAYDGNNSVHTMVSVFSFLGPCLFLLLIIASAVLACCCYWPASYQQEVELSSNNATPRIDSLEGSVIPSTDKPPTYEELFFPKGNGSLPALDDRESKAETPSPPPYESVRHPYTLPTIHS